MDSDAIIQRIKSLNSSGDYYVLFKCGNCSNVYYGIAPNDNVVFLLEADDLHARAISQTTNELRFDSNINVELVVDGRESISV